MAEAHITVSARVRDMDRTRLFVFQLQSLLDDMRVGASPFAPRLESALDRYIDGGDDEGEGVITDSVVETVEVETPCPNCGYT